MTAAVIRRLRPVIRGVRAEMDRRLARGTEDLVPADALYLRRHNAWALLFVCLVPVIVVAQIGSGQHVTAAVNVVYLLGFVAIREVALRARPFRPSRIAGLLAATLMWSVADLIVTALLNGGIDASGLWYLCLVPLIVAHVRSARETMVWTAFCFLAVFFVLVVQPVWPFVREFEHEPAGVVVLMRVLLLMSVGAFAVASRGLTDKQFAALAEREARLAEQARQLRIMKADADAARARAERTAVELTIAKAHADEASRLKSQFLANVSHELRTPMNIIIGMTDIVLDREHDEETVDYLNRVRGASLALLSLLNDVLDLAKIEAGKMDVDVRPFDVRGLLDDVARLFAAPAAAKNLSVAVRVDPALPARLGGDAARLRQVLTNLVGNAIKFTERGEVTLELRLVTEGARQIEVCFAVHDTGPGIPVERQQAIFESFTQGDAATSSRFGGTGLGLTISRQLVELMGGTLRLDSVVGEGSTFAFVLRLDRCALPDAVVAIAAAGR